MKSLRWLSLCAAVAFISPSAWAFQNEPTGFRQILWGTPFDEVKDQFTPMSVNKPANAPQLYSRMNDSLRIGGATLDSILYSFYKNQFASVFITSAKGIENRRAMRAAYEAQFGPGKKPNQFIDRYFWDGPQALISLTCSDARDECTSIIQSMRIFLQERDDKRREAEQGTKDF